jgi:hypothetical protein
VVHAFLYSGSIELNRFQWRPNLPFVISSKCLNKNTHNKKKPAYYKWHCAWLQIKPMKLCAFASEIADGLVEIKA